MCDVCIKEKPVAGVASSALGPISFGYCAECLANQSEPEWILAYTLDEVGHGDPDKLHEWVKTISTWKNGRYYSGDEWVQLRMANAI